jgi:hypothetical protein
MARALFEAVKLAPSFTGEPAMSEEELEASQRGAFTALAEAQVKKKKKKKKKKKRRRRRRRGRSW